MSFSFFRQSRHKTPQELAKAIKDSLMAIDNITAAEVKSLEKDASENCSYGSSNLDISAAIEADVGMEEVEKNIMTMRTMVSGDGEVEPSADQITQLALEICNEDVISLLFHKLPILGWEARKNLVHCWSILLKQKVDSVNCCEQYMEKHLELLDFLVVCYDNKEIALTCGHMLRECIKFPTLSKYILDSPCFELFFKFIELPTFDVASDAFSTFKDLMTKHPTAVSEYLTTHYNEFFEQYEKLLTSANYVTRRQSLKLLSDFLLESPSTHIMKRYIGEVRHLKIMMTLLKVFVANPNKPRDIKLILAKNHEKLLALLQNLSPGKGAEDDQFEEEKELIIKEIDRVHRLTEI
ncbi:hypothetical protein SASPL_100378 [Salvia splendens]|uniref:Calcium binding protein 39 n=1 Tax=Salvia splendens TaxID=180675 RepID=A0A8X8YPX3_SALSN|nr:hypothetical protein SASPL_100378 [Salvia splendens]